MCTDNLMSLLCVLYYKLYSWSGQTTPAGRVQLQTRGLDSVNIKGSRFLGFRPSNSINLLFRHLKYNILIYQPRKKEEAFCVPTMYKISYDDFKRTKTGNCILGASSKLMDTGRLFMTTINR